MNMIKCNNCRANNPAGFNFCDSCGMKIEKKSDPKVKPADDLLMETSNNLDYKKAVFFIIIIFGIISRFVLLGDKPLHHDESMYSYYAWQYFIGNGYFYDPMLHGPFLYHANALIYFLLGDNNFTCRVLPALFGVFCIIIMYSYRHYLGRRGYIITAFIIMISPIFMYQSRYIRMDILIAAAAFIMFLGLIRYIDTRKPLYLYISSFGLALSFATKEVTFITGFIFLTFILFRILWEQINYKNNYKKLKWSIIDTLQYLFVKDRKNLFISLGIFSGVIILLYSSFFTNLKGIADAFSKSLTYWLSQHNVQRGIASKTIYIELMLFYETLCLFFTVIATGYYIIKKKHRTFINLFLIYWWLLALIIYSWAGERMPWLLINISIPMVLLVGKFLGEIWEGKINLNLKKLSVIIFIILAFTSLKSAIQVSFIGDGANTKEPLVYVQTTTDVHAVVKSIKKTAFAMRTDPNIDLSDEKNITITMEPEATWPFCWYLRKYKNVIYSTNVLNLGSDSSIIISDVTSPQHDMKIYNMLKEKYIRRRYKLRDWWVPDKIIWKRMSLKEKIKCLWKHYAFREIWSPQGSTDFYVYIQREYIRFWD